MKPDLLLMGPMFPPTQKVLEASYTVHKVWEAPDRDAFLASVADRITAVASTGGKGIDDATMGKLPKLKVISHFGVGVDSVDVDAVRRRGLALTNTPDVLTEDVADVALMLMLAAIRRVPQGDRYVREGKWLKGPMPLTRSLQDGKTVGIIGLGRIGKAIAKRCEAFNLKVAYQGRNKQAGVSYPYYADPLALAKDVDIIVVAAPGGAETRGMVSRAVMEALGPDGTIVNIARGSLIDEAAMIECLRDGKLGAAGLDVFDKEPAVPEALLALDNVVVQPHVGSATHPTRTAMGQLVIDNLAAHFAGKPLVTPHQ
ncbi:2-hydroxyacid dehydrogenase [Usitatibacter palustris]|uniref:2-ketogluconate reductase n=1 Tax=Usitatibacter palustris TaxID=2732487 RepID=A0A6M4H5A9_9PROT|nr:2-hydroxyacid dehydrogenase [Usitatibacter palustris]QJR14796.1 2-ketogluconate reductase [Usitatibacter palustris]